MSSQKYPNTKCKVFNPLILDKLESMAERYEAFKEREAEAKKAFGRGFGGGGNSGNGRGGGGGGRGCFNCGKDGHISRNCQEPKRR